MIANRRDFGQRRVVVMAAVVGVAFLVIVTQLWYLQVISGRYFREASEKNRIRIRPIAAQRGILYDRQHRPLVDNRPAFTLSLIPRELDEAGTDAPPCSAACRPCSAFPIASSRRWRPAFTVIPRLPCGCAAA